MTDFRIAEHVNNVVCQVKLLRQSIHLNSERKCTFLIQEKSWSYASYNRPITFSCSVLKKVNIYYLCIGKYY